jgi:hypothetical protein
MIAALTGPLPLLRPRRRGGQAEIEPPLEHATPVHAQLVRSSVEVLEQPRERAWAEQALEGLGVGRNLGPLLRDLARELEVELDAVGPASEAEGLVRVDR